MFYPESNLGMSQFVKMFHAGVTQLRKYTKPAAEDILFKNVNSYKSNKNVRSET